MASKPNPLDITDGDIEDMYREMWGFSEGNYQKKMSADLLMAEMNRRLIEKTSEENAKLAVENQKLSIENHVLSKRSIFISIFALFVALTSAIFSFIDWKEDGIWQSQQISELSKITSNIIESNRLLEKHLSLKSMNMKLENERYILITELLKESNKLLLPTHSYNSEATSNENNEMHNK